MKNWTKFERDLLQDERVRRLVNELGMKGLGVYTQLRIAAECEDGLTAEKLLRMGCLYSRRRLVSEVLYFYGLFTTDSKGHVRVCSRKPVRASVRASVPASDPAGDPVGDPALVPSIGTEREIEEDVKEDDDEDDVTGGAARYRTWLLDEASLPWRESVMMQSGMSRLLMAHWPEAVDYFLQHAMAQDELRRLCTVHDVRRYFCNYCKASKPSGRALMEHLLALEALGQGSAAQPTENALWR